MQILFPNNIADFLALSLTSAGVLVFIFAILINKRFNYTLPLSLDFWLAAGLIRLSGSPDWTTVVSAASIIIVRKLVMLAINKRAESEI
jgi:uncharacterized membrane protein